MRGEPPLDIQGESMTRTYRMISLTTNKILSERGCASSINALLDQYGYGPPLLNSHGLEYHRKPEKINKNKVNTVDLCGFSEGMIMKGERRQILNND